MATVHENVDQMLNKTQSEVVSRFDDAKSYADSSYEGLRGFLESLKTAIGDLHPAAVSTVENVFEPLEIDVTGDVPTEDLSAIDDIISDIESERKPVRPTLTIPDWSGIVDIEPINQMRDDIMGEFNRMLSLIESIRGELAGINFNDTYASDLLTALKNKVLELMQTGGAGFDDEVLNRELQRDVQARQDAIDDLVDQFPGHGFSLPNGFLLANIRKIETEWQNKRLEILNAYAAKEIEIRHKTQEAAIQAGIEIEKALMDYELRVKALVIEAKKAIVQLAVSIIDGLNKILDAYVEILKAQATAFDSMVRGEMAKAELYKSEVSAYMAMVEAHSKVIDAYVKKLAAQTEILKEQISLAETEGKLQLQAVEFSQRNTITSQERALRAHEIAIQDATRKSQVFVEIQRGIVAALSQLVASALTSIHVSAQLHASGNASEQYSFSEEYQHRLSS